MTAHEWGPTKGMPQHQRDALRNLMDADGWTQRPCRDPRSWDVPPRLTVATDIPAKDRQAHNRDVTAHVEVLRRACLIDCGVYQLCKAYSDTRPDVTGALAGMSDDERHTHAPTDQEPS